MDQQHVEAAVSALKAQGEPVSVRRVHSVLGGHGSFRDISRYLRILLPNALPDADEDGPDVVTPGIEPAERAPTLIEEQTQRIHEAAAEEREARAAYHTLLEEQVVLQRRLEDSPRVADATTVAAVAEQHAQLQAQMLAVKRQLPLLQGFLKAKEQTRHREEEQLAQWQRDLQFHRQQHLTDQRQRPTLVHQLQQAEAEARRIVEKARRDLANHDALHAQRTQRIFELAGPGAVPLELEVAHEGILYWGVNTI